VPQVMLHGSRIVPVVSEFVAAGMAKHVGMYWKGYGSAAAGLGH
jgi:hypothetical protein